MQYIVLDLEYNKLTMNDERNVKRSNIFEVIEIGAIKLDDDFNIIDEFRIFIKPEIYSHLSRKFMKLTNISKEDLQHGCNFNLAIKDFKKWIGEDYIFCLWATDDISILEKNISFYNIEINIEEWFENFINLQYETSKYFNEKHQSSLASAIERLGISVENKSFHRALDDAYFTAKVLQKYSKEGHIL